MKKLFLTLLVMSGLTLAGHAMSVPVDASAEAQQSTYRINGPDEVNAGTTHTYTVVGTSDDTYWGLDLDHPYGQFVESYSINGKSITITFTIPPGQNRGIVQLYCYKVGDSSKYGWLEILVYK